MAIVGLDELLSMPGAEAELLARGFVRASDQRGGVNFWKLRTLAAVWGALSSLPDSECKPIGNLHPDGLHCFSCTFYDLRKRTERAYDFWRKGERFRDALS